MQNKTIVYVVAGVVVVGVIGWVLFGMKGSTGSPQGTGAPTGGEEQAQGSPMSMKGLLTSGVSQKCTFQNGVAGAQSNGTVYVTAGHMRGDFASVAGGQTMTSHMITDGTTAYVWTEGTAQGVKMSFENVGAQSQGSGQSGVDVNAAVNYNCSPWGVEQASFQTPAGIDFVDLSTMMQGGVQLPGGYTLPEGTPGQDYSPQY